MRIFDIIIPILLLVLLLKQLKYIKKLIIPTRKSYIQIIFVLISVIILTSITYFYGNKWIHYIVGALASSTYICMWIKQGINSKGFVSMYRYKETISWNEIEKVIITSSKDVKVKLFGDFMEQTFYFKNGDYEKVLTFLKENLPKEAQLQIN